MSSGVLSKTPPARAILEAVYQLCLGSTTSRSARGYIRQYILAHPIYARSPLSVGTGQLGSHYQEERKRLCALYTCASNAQIRSLRCLYVMWSIPSLPSRSFSAQL